LIWKLENGDGLNNDFIRHIIILTVLRELKRRLIRHNNTRIDKSQLLDPGLS